MAPLGRYEVFATLAATALLFRWEPGIYANHPGWNVTITGWIPVAAALGVLLNPRDVRMLLAMYVGVFIDVAHTAPMVPNHYLLTTCVGISLFVLVGAARARDAAAQWTDLGDRALDLGAPAMRVAIAVFYLFTGLWKSNAGFMDHDISCGALSWMRLVHQFPFLPAADPARDLVIGFTLVLELVGPFVLLWKPARAPLGAFFVFFHFVLATDFAQNYQNFSWTMSPLLTLFLPDDAWPRATPDLPSLRSSVSAFQRLAFAGHIGLVLIAFSAPQMAHGIGRYLFGLFLYSGFFLIYCFVAGLTWKDGAQRDAYPAPAWMLLFLVVFNGITPILGIKNRNAWQMYSNVRIEPDASNHVLFPPSLDLFGFQRETVRVLDTDDLVLRHDLVDLKLGMTWWDFRVWASQNPLSTAEYERDGKVAKVGPGHPPIDPPPYLLTKVVWFRPVGPGVEAQCQW